LPPPLHDEPREPAKDAMIKSLNHFLNENFSKRIFFVWEKLLLIILEKENLDRITSYIC